MWEFFRAWKKLFLWLLLVLAVVGLILGGWFAYKKIYIKTETTSPVSKITRPAILPVAVQTDGIENYTFTIQEDEIRQELTTLGFTKENGVGLHNTQDVIWSNAATLKVFITQVPQFWPGIITKSNNITTFDIKSDPEGNINLIIGLDDPTLLDNKERLSNQLNKTLYIAMYKVTHWADGQDQTTLDYLTEKSAVIKDQSLNERLIIVE